MRTIEIHLSDPTYYDLIARAAEEQQDVEEFAKAQLMGVLGKEDATDDGLSFDERVVQAFGLDPGMKTAANVVGVATRMADGMSWTDAYRARAEAYAADNSNIKDPETYADTVRDCCTRQLGLSAGEFQDRVHTLIENYHQRTEEASEPTTTDPRPAGARTGSYEVRLSDGHEVVATFGTDAAADQSEIMQLVVNHLITEYDLIDRIPIPYVVEEKALANSTPTCPDSDEEMRHYKQLTNGYYLDTHYKKEDKRARLTELAGECGLGATFGEGWERR
jgi:hypothetical protein